MKLSLIVIHDILPGEGSSVHDISKCLYLMALDQVKVTRYSSSSPIGIICCNSLFFFSLGLMCACLSDLAVLLR